MQISLIPHFLKTDSCQSNNVLPNNSTKHLGLLFVSGLSLLPSPAAKTIAFMIISYSFILENIF